MRDIWKAVYENKTFDWDNDQLQFGLVKYLAKEWHLRLIKIKYSIKPKYNNEYIFVQIKCHSEFLRITKQW